MTSSKGVFTRFLLPVIAVGMLVFAVISVLGRKEPEPYTPQVTPPSTPYQAQLGGVGIVEPKSEIVSVGAHLPGIVTEVAVAVGDEVKAGDLLFAIDNRDTQSQLEAAKAAAAAAKAEAESAHYQLSLYSRVADKRAISDDELSRRRFAAQTANAKAKEATAQVGVLETQLARLRVTAPMNGTILRVNIRPGEYAPAGVLQNPLILMGDVSTMHVRVEIDESDALLVSPDAKATASVRGYPDRKTDLTFVRKEAYVRPKRSLTGDGNERVDTRVQEVIYAFDNATIGAYVGQQMDVFIESAARGQGAE